MVRPWPRPGWSADPLVPDGPAEGLVVGVAVAVPDAEAVADSRTADGLDPALGPVDVVPEEAPVSDDRAPAVPPGASEPVAAAGDPVRPCPPSVPSGDDDPESDNPEITAASDTAPTAPAITTGRRERRAARRRRARPPGAVRSPVAVGPHLASAADSRASPPPSAPWPPPGAAPSPPPSTTTGSRAVASNAFPSHPCAAAGSAYSS
ncbi:hypothetical protein ACQEWB_30575 [Streptomyces sp. CA-249302]|uniref:hypothetical protein n=1 Tax=Streptomyces sp. CA-249302 TaxID=3240058 RepID=UPI003D9450A3